MENTIKKVIAFYSNGVLRYSRCFWPSSCSEHYLKTKENTVRYCVNVHMSYQPVPSRFFSDITSTSDVNSVVESFFCGH